MIHDPKTGEKKTEFLELTVGAIRFIKCTQNCAFMFGEIGRIACVDLNTLKEVEFQFNFTKIVNYICEPIIIPAKNSKENIGKIMLCHKSGYLSILQVFNDTKSKQSECTSIENDIIENYHFSSMKNSFKKYSFSKIY